MNSLGLSFILKMGCICAKETITVNGRKYTVREHLGDGGFGTVLLAEDRTTREKYAIKKIICHSLEDERLAIQEMKYHKMLKHPNIIECVDSARTGSADPVVDSTSQVLLILPYYRKGTLASELERRARTKRHFLPSEVLNIFLQICEAVRVFHEAKPEPLAHRDLKTSNILVGDDDAPVVMDLGSVAPARVKVCGARDARALRDVAAERCSMPYRAPELFNVESYCVIDERTDIWSLGCILYALCFFESPFDAVYEKGDSVALAVISANVSFPENSPYDEEMEKLILSMLKVNPMERPYIYGVIEGASDALAKLEGRV